MPPAVCSGAGALCVSDCTGLRVHHGGGTLVATAPVVISRRPVLVVSSRGSTVPDCQLSCDWQYEFGQPAQASVKLNRLPSWLDFWTPITVAAGATDATVEVRFSGY